VISDQSTYEISLPLPSDATTGIWEMRDLRFGGMKEVKISMDKKVVFDVFPATGVIYPTKAEVSINLNQQQLLRREADRLQRRIQEFKAELSAQKQDSTLTEILRRNVQNSLKNLDETEMAFRKVSTNASIDNASKIFFDDLRRSYKGALLTIQGHASTSRHPID
jgi:hypothetical protein